MITVIAESLTFHWHAHGHLPVPVDYTNIGATGPGLQYRYRETCLSFFTAFSLQVHHNAHGGIFAQTMYCSSFQKMTLLIQNSLEHMPWNPSLHTRKMLDFLTRLAQQLNLIHLICSHVLIYPST